MIVPDDRGPQKKLIIKSNETLPMVEIKLLYIINQYMLYKYVKICKYIHIYIHIYKYKYIYIYIIYVMYINVK